MAVEAATVNPHVRYGKVIILLENCIIPSEKLSPTPSLLDGLDSEYELDLRILGCDLIQTSGILLKLPQVAMATGQVLFQRFYYSKSFVRHSMEVVAMSCITLASKIEESPRRIRDVINVFHHIKQVRAGKNIQPLILDQNYINLKNQVIKGERRVLKELGFCVHVKHPHKVIVTLLQVLECEKNQRLMQTAWNYMNDSLRSDVFVRYSPEAISCACISLSARLLKIPLPTKPVWYSLFGVPDEDVQGISLAILRLYARPKPDPEKLEEIVEELKKVHQLAKLRARALAGNSTPLANNAGFSPASQQNSPKKSNAADNRKDEAHTESSPKVEKETNHVNSHHKHNSRSSPSPIKRERSKSSSAGSRSSSPKRKAKTPPRGYKEPLPTRSRSRDRKENKHRNSHKHKRSRSRSRTKSRSRSPHWRVSTNPSKKPYKEKEKVSHKPRSLSREHASRHHVSSKSTKSRKLKEYTSHRSRSHSRERNRR